MQFLPVPKLMKWVPSVDQHYSCPEKILVTSGCSFTSSTTQLETAASWPGYVLDRCRFDHCIDYSYPGAGNEYIGDSILHFFSQVADQDVDQYMTIIMWSGLDRKEDKIAGTIMPNINGISYIRKELCELSKKDQPPLSPSEQAERKTRAMESANKMLEVYEYLSNRKIAHAFCMYSNLLFAPYLIPKRDTTFEFDGYVSKSMIKQLQNLPWITTEPFDFMYEYAFTNDFLNNEDQFHPNFKCHLKWTDQILLAKMCQQGLIKKL